MPVMNAEEENALRYASAYVALKLMRKYEKEDSARAAQFLECLSAVHLTPSRFFRVAPDYM